MPISKEWKPESGLWTLTTGEAFDLAEVSELLKTTDWRGARRFLWDLRRLHEGPDSGPEIRQAVDLAGRGETLWTGSRVAIVVARDLDFGIARMFQSFAEGSGAEYQIFRDMTPALDWLGAGES